MEYRRGIARDVDEIAALHADSWRRNYRGAFSDAYLDGDVFTDRKRVWTDRLTRRVDNEFAIVAEDDDHVVGFAYVILGEHPRWGALVDNLHVRNDEKGRGVGTRLMAAAAAELLTREPEAHLHLTVLEQNTGAQAFYDARGGVRVERIVRDPFPGGGSAPVLRYAWSDPSVLLLDGS